MEIFYYTLGILSVLVVIGIFGMVKVWNKISEIEFSGNDMEDYIGDTADDFSDELEKLHALTQDEVDRLDREFREESNELGKLIDSRFDKYDNLINKRFEQLEGTIARLIVKENR
mgnify:FL=1|tara:strand:+ start:2044 stop:2388 length:345 start_codon:yes stop_codon:yes gene_type:complete